MKAYFGIDLETEEKDEVYWIEDDEAIVKKIKGLSDESKIVIMQMVDKLLIADEAMREGEQLELIPKRELTMCTSLIIPPNNE